MLGPGCSDVPAQLGRQMPCACCCCPCLPASDGQAALQGIGDWRRLPSSRQAQLQKQNKSTAALGQVSGHSWTSKLPALRSSAPWDLAGGMA